MSNDNDTWCYSIGALQQVDARHNTKQGVQIHCTCACLNEAWYNIGVWKRFMDITTKMICNNSRMSMIHDVTQ